MEYDPPLYRPPSEGDNLIVQATLGCSFNGCTFCSMYKSKTYRARPMAEVFADVEEAARDWPDAHRVFIADGDALAMPVEDMLALLAKLKAELPELARVSAYATPINLLRKSPDDLCRIRDAGLGLLYVGIESGSGDVLRRIRKGATQASMIKALERAKDAGFKVSATVVLGLGDRPLLTQLGHSAAGRVKKNVLPFPGSLSTQIRPPCRSTMRFTTASPTPVPSYSLRPCSLWKI